MMRIILSLFFLTTFLYCNPAQSKVVPGEFGLSNFDNVIKYALDNYLDPDSVNESRAYTGAAEAALRSLPYPLVLMTEEFYTKREQVQPPERVIPGQPVKLSSRDSFVILIPDYDAFEEKRSEYEERQRQRREGMSAEERIALAREARERLKEEQEFIEETWENVSFSRRDFRRVTDWIQENHEEYLELPAGHVGDNPFEEEPFDMHHAYFAAANGFLQTMDPHSGIMDMETWDRIRRESEDSSFEGIGAMLRGGGSQDVIVETPLPGSPAVSSGLRAGDIIRKVDGENIDNMPLSEVVKRIRGPRDTVVVLGIERPAELSVLDIEIKRGVIEQKAISSRYLPDEMDATNLSGKIGVIRLTSFLYDQSLPSEAIRKEYFDLLDRADGELDGLILDLRNNPGGDLDESINVAGLFLERGSTVVQIRGSGRPRRRTSGGAPLFEPNSIPLIVLINAGSASASEIVASAVMDHNAGLIIGERSFGKATVQGLRSWQDVIVKLTTARYYAPAGYTVQVHGVRPDVEISDEVDGSFPPRFREEDMWTHIPELADREPEEAREEWVARLNEFVGENRLAEDLIQERASDAIRPDVMLIRALAYIDAMQEHPSP